MLKKIVFTAFFIVLISLTFKAHSQTSDQIISLMHAGEFEEARKMSMQLVKRNDSVALFTLGYLDLRKRSAEGNKSAFNYMLQAAKQDYLPAMSQIGVLYLEAVGTQKNLAEGVAWLKKASDRGELFAAFNLGLNYVGHFGDEQRPQLALEQFLKISVRKDLEQTEDWVMSTFYIGLLAVNSPEQAGRALSHSSLVEVLKSKLATPRVNWAKKEIAILVEKGLSKAGQGDGSDDDKLCQGFGFQVLSDDYPRCRMRVEIARREALDRQRAYDLAKRRYDEEVAQYEQQRIAIERERERQKGEALLRFGLALMGGTSPSAAQNFANAGRQMLGMPPVEPPRPKFESFTITNPGGRMVNCTAVGNVINCF